jgi:hypothetical protein
LLNKEGDEMNQKFKKFKERERERENEREREKERW